MVALIIQQLNRTPGGLHVFGGFAVLISIPARQFSIFLLARYRSLVTSHGGDLTSRTIAMCCCFGNSTAQGLQAVFTWSETSCYSCTNFAQVLSLHMVLTCRAGVCLKVTLQLVQTHHPFCIAPGFVSLQKNTDTAQQSLG